MFSFELVTGLPAIFRALWSCRFKATVKVDVVVIPDSRRAATARIALQAIGLNLELNSLVDSEMLRQASVVHNDTARNKVRYLLDAGWSETHVLDQLRKRCAEPEEWDW